MARRDDTLGLDEASGLRRSGHGWGVERDKRHMEERNARSQARERHHSLGLEEEVEGVEAEVVSLPAEVQGV
jgi:hypothetical protein